MSSQGSQIESRAIRQQTRRGRHSRICRQREARSLRRHYILQSHGSCQERPRPHLSRYSRALVERITKTVDEVHKSVGLLSHHVSAAEIEVSRREDISHPSLLGRCLVLIVASENCLLHGRVSAQHDGGPHLVCRRHSGRESRLCREQCLPCQCQFWRGPQLHCSDNSKVGHAKQPHSS
jgi:hypothetical protein